MQFETLIRLARIGTGILGAGLVVVGVAHWSPAAAYVVGGGFLVVDAVLAGRAY